MDAPETVRMLRYHMSSGHVLQEIVDPVLADTDDLTILETIAGTCETTLYIKIKEATSDTPVLVAVNAIEFVQVANILVQTIDLMGAERSEDEAIARATEHLNGDNDND